MIVVSEESFWRLKVAPLVDAMAGAVTPGFRMTGRDPALNWWPNRVAIAMDALALTKLGLGGPRPVRLGDLAEERAVVMQNILESGTDVNRM